MQYFEVRLYYNQTEYYVGTSLQMGIRTMAKPSSYSIGYHSCAALCLLLIKE